jgi:Tol biopolymer transport system component
MRALVSLGVLIALIPSASVGFYFPPPGDRSPSWSPDGQRIAFLTGRLGGGLAVVNADGSGEVRLFEDPIVLRALSPDWTKVAFVNPLPSPGELYVQALDGTQTRKLADGVAGFAWAPDSKRLAFVRAEALYVVGDDGSEMRQVAAAAVGAPVWSPDGTRIAFRRRGPNSQTDLSVVGADGSGETNLTDDADTNVEPRWSPDGRLLAFITTDGRRTRLEVIDVAGGNRRVLPVDSVVTNSEVAWTPDGSQIWVGIDAGLVTVDLSTAKTRSLFRFPLLAGAGLDWSPDGRRVTFAAGGECRDREGIYVAEANGTAVRRVTNDCRIIGTEGADELRGTDLADVLVGLGGNDRLLAVDPGYVGDTLEGGSGADVLTGDYRSDTLEGGSGGDVLRGGPSGDHLDGGAGRDRVDGEGGRDVISARDGERDVVVCGTNIAGTPELDTATVDRFDVVASDCEVVHGKRATSNRIGTAGRTSLTIHVWPQGKQRAAKPQRWTLACQPARGTLPRRARACRLLLAMRRPFRPVPPGTACTEIYGGPHVAEIRGRFRGRRVSTQFRRTDGCQIERWNRVGFLFPS